MQYANENTTDYLVRFRNAQKVNEACYGSLITKGLQEHGMKTHHCPDSIREDASLDGSDQGLSCGLDDTINNDSDFEDIEKQSHHLSLKSSMRMNEISHTG